MFICWAAAAPGLYIHHARQLAADAFGGTVARHGVGRLFVFRTTTTRVQHINHVLSFAVLAAGSALAL